MTEPTHGSLFSGYDGLGIGVRSVLGGRLEWVSDIDPGACKVLAHRYPGVPNLGDITKVDWAGVPPVDVMDGGSPCQDLSGAGRRAGMTDGTRSNLWVAMREGIAVLRPSLVIWENVRGAYSAQADSALESDPRLLAGVRRRDGQPVLRALGRVLGDLSELGYVGGWVGLRAADVGAPHGRFRVFVVAADSGSEHLIERWLAASRETQGGWPLGQPAGRRGAPADVALLPTPIASDMHNPPTTARADERAASYGRGVKLSEHVIRSELAKGYNGNGGGTPLAMTVRLADQWRQYAPAIHRWEDVTRSAPDATERNWEAWQKARDRRFTSTKPVGYRGSLRRFTMPPSPRLSPRFPEWMMGVPDGHITDVPDITRNEALKLCGNGVVPQQSAAAVWIVLTHLLEQGLAA